MCPALKQQCFAMSLLSVRHANSSVVGCKNQHQHLYSVPEQQKRQWLCLIFNNNVPAALPVSLCVLTTSHRTASVTRVSRKPALP